MNGQLFQTGLLALCVGLAVALGQALPRCFEGRLPQAPGEDVLALVLGDARLEISRTLEDKAEEYFHGGVRHSDCPRRARSEEKAEGHDGQNAQGAHDADGDRDEHDRHGGAHDAEGAVGFDPWLWVDRRVHVQEHRELKGDQTVEVLPWLWAASRMSSKNTQAYENGAYVLANVLGKPGEGVLLLEEGIRNNPASPELDFSLGEVLFNRLHDAAHAEPWFASARAKCLPVQSSAAKAEELLLLRLRAVFYLGYIAKQRGDLDRARACLEEAESLEPASAATRDLRTLLKASGTKP